MTDKERIATDKLIDEKLKFSTEVFQKECFQIYKEMIDKNIEEAYSRIYNKLDSEIRNNIMQKIGGSDMYDYSKVTTTDQFPGYNSLESLLNRYNDGSAHIDNQKRYKKIIDEFKKGIQNGEKIIICHDFHESDKSWTILITNYARIVELTRHCQWYLFGEYEAFDYYIPIDYIMILQRICENRYGQEQCKSKIQYKTFHDILKNIKGHLYNRKIIPLYVQDIVKENEELRGKYDQYAKDKSELDKKIVEYDIAKSHFEEYVKPYTDLEKEKEEVLQARKEVQEQRDKLRMIAKKIEIEKAKIAAEWKKFNEVDINDLDKM
jgi:hypothetical protein